MKLVLGAILVAVAHLAAAGIIQDTMNNLQQGKSKLQGGMSNAQSKLQSGSRDAVYRGIAQYVVHSSDANMGYGKYGVVNALIPVHNGGNLTGVVDLSPKGNQGAYRVPSARDAGVSRVDAATSTVLYASKSGDAHRIPVTLELLPTQQAQDAWYSYASSMGAMIPTSSVDPRSLQTLYNADASRSVEDYVKHIRATSAPK